MTAFLFANQTDHFRHVPSTVEKLPGKAISTTFYQGAWFSLVMPTETSSKFKVSFACEKGPFGSRDILFFSILYISLSLYV